MKLQDLICGFRVVREVKSEELGGTLWSLCHEKTGAELVWLDNGESNMLFSIAFKTLPWDDTGVFHILEHSVLGGSEHYPVKEPFLDMLKGSMNTFLNAYTFPDKTMYPVSSRNEQDFMNLVSVYLDAVFCTAIYKNPNIFAQEGWHYELHEGDTAPIYKGVVFNEMKGACSSVDTVMELELNRRLFPDNCYQYLGGGHPAAIPDLTYERFLQAHRDCYHPSNARIYLDGALPLSRVLAQIDGYLGRYEKAEPQPAIIMQEPVPAQACEAYYEIGKDEDAVNKTQIVFGKILCDWSDRKKQLAGNVLASYLAGSNAAPLKRAVLESGLAQDLDLIVNEGIAQIPVMLCVRNTEAAHKEQIKRIIRETCERLLEGGLDAEELAADINQMEFSMKEQDEPKGIGRAIAAQSSWLYGGDPLLYLLCDDDIAAVRGELGTGYFEALLREMLLDDEHMVEVTVLPSKSLGDETRAAEQARLAQAQAKWSEEERQALLAAQKALESWQASVDTPEALATLPRLSVADIDPLPEKQETQVTTRDGVTILHHPMATNGVVHVNLHFNVADLPLEKFADLSFLCGLFTELPTAHYTVEELQRELKKYVGFINVGLTPYSVVGNPDVCRPFLTVSFSVLEQNVPVAVELVCEIVTHTSFADAGQIQEILLQDCESMYQGFIEQGNKYAGMRTLRGVSASSAVLEQIEGYDFYRRIQAFAENFEAQIGAFQAWAQKICGQLFTTARLTISETAAAQHEELLAILPLLGCAGQAGAAELPAQMTVELAKTPVKEAIQIPAGISYAAMGGNLRDYGANYNGKLMVLSGILSYGYLWNEVRVKGGAYGCGFGANTSGNVTFRSFRDPSPLRSLDVYRGTAEFIRSYCANEESVEKYIISSVANTEPLLAPAKKGMSADTEYFCGATYEDKCARRRQMLDLKKEELLELCELFEKMSEQSSVCVIGHEAVVAELDESWNVYQL